MKGSHVRSGASSRQTLLAALLTVLFAVLVFAALPPVGDQRRERETYFSSLGRIMGWNLRWKMFSPEMPRTNAFLYAEVKKRDGSCEVVVSPMARRLPPHEAFFSEQWGKFLQDGYSRLGQREGLAHFADGLVNELEKGIPEASSVRILFAVNPIPPPLVDGRGRLLHRREFIPLEHNHATDVSLIVKTWRDGTAR